MNKSIFVLMAISIVIAAAMIPSIVASAHAQGASGLAGGREQSNPGDAKDLAPGHEDKVFDAPGKEALDAGLIGPKK